MSDFSEALRCVKAGGSAYRQGWRGNAYDAVLRWEHQAGFRFPLLVTVFPDDGTRAVFAGAQTDLLADDWVLDWSPSC